MCLWWVCFFGVKRTGCRLVFMWLVLIVCNRTRPMRASAFAACGMRRRAFRAYRPNRAKVAPLFQPNVSLSGIIGSLQVGP